MAKYKNPPITEAVCEIIFKVESRDPALPGLLYSQVKDLFPERDSRLSQDLQFKTEGASFRQETIFREVSIFRNQTGQFIQVNENKLSIHTLPPYPGWQSFFDLISKTFNAYQSLMDKPEIERIGIRYVNSIKRISNRISDNLNIIFQLEKPLPSEYINFIFSFVAPYRDACDNCRLQLAVDSQDIETIILDLDYFTAPGRSVSAGDVLGWIQTAHNEIEVIFENALKEELKQTFVFIP